MYRLSVTAVEQWIALGGVYQHLSTICNSGLCNFFEERYLFKVDGSLSKVKLEATLPVATASTGIIAACPELPLHPENQKNIG